jgi:multicomponent Na+:H+ antiporter subunit E
MDLIDRESHPIHLTTKIPQYWLWLIWEIVKANILVTKLIWHPRLSINPTVLRVKASQSSALGKVIYANSITLTPGTVSMNVENDEIEVHALTPELAQDLQSGVMDRRVADLE